MHAPDFFLCSGTLNAEAGWNMTVGMPTVILTQKVRPDCLAEYRARKGALLSLVRVQPGFSGVELLEPVEGLQDEWVVVFRFATGPDLQHWLDLPERKKLLCELRETLTEDPVFQVLADDQGPGRPVAVVFSHRIRAGAMQIFDRWHREILTCQAKSPGHLGTQTFPPVEGVQEEWVDLVRFDSLENLELWMGSPERRKLLERMGEFSEKFTERRLATGLEGWFADGRQRQAAPVPWKQGLAVLLALYPTIMLLNLFLGPLLQGWDPAFRMLLMNVFSVSLLTFVVMPQVSRILSPWLHGSQKGLSSVWGPLGIAAVLLVLALVFFFMERLSLP